MPFRGGLIPNEGDTSSPSPPPISEPSPKAPPVGHVILKVNERPARVAMWLNQNFLLNDDEVTPDENGNLPDLVFMCLRTKPKVSLYIIICFILLENQSDRFKIFHAYG